MRVFFISTAMYFLPVIAEACTVCFGGADSGLREGFKWGIIVLISLPYILLTVFISTIVYQIKKNKSKRKVAP